MKLILLLFCVCHAMYWNELKTEDSLPVNCTLESIWPRNEIFRYQKNNTIFQTAENQIYTISCELIINTLIPRTHFFIKPPKHSRIYKYVNADIEVTNYFGASSSFYFNGKNNYTFIIRMITYPKCDCTSAINTHMFIHNGIRALFGLY